MDGWKENKKMDTKSNEIYVRRRRGITTLTIPPWPRPCSYSCSIDHTGKEFPSAFGNHFILCSLHNFPMFRLECSTEWRPELHPFELLIGVFFLIIWIGGTNNGSDFTESAMVYVVQDFTDTAGCMDRQPAGVGKDTFGVALQLVGSTEHSKVQDQTKHNQCR